MDPPGPTGKCFGRPGHGPVLAEKASFRHPPEYTRADRGDNVHLHVSGTFECNARPVTIRIWKAHGSAPSAVR